MTEIKEFLWYQSARNTFFCLLGCMTGDYAALFLLQHYYKITILLMLFVAVPAGLITSITLESLILLRQMDYKKAIQTAFGMSIFSMILMEITANIIAMVLNNGQRLVWWVIIPSTVAGFFAAWPYNYYRLKRFGKACH